MIYKTLISTCVLLGCASSSLAEVKVMASIKPIHSLVASVMKDVGTPGLIVSGNASPHNYALKPSDAEALQEADVIFWVGSGLEAFLEKPLESLGSKAKIVALIRAPGVNTLAIRDSAGFDRDEHDHGEADVDGHIWLDPENAKAVVQTIAATLATQDPANARTYEENARKTIAEFDILSKDIAAQVSPLKGKGFIVFHDAYHYFENRFGLPATGAISIHPETTPGAKAIIDIKQRIANNNVMCVFAEPQFDSALIATVIEGTSVKSATLDPEGASLAPGPALYETVMRNIAKSLQDCLS
jgi:zinc transport system substrate-binding protein